MKIDEDSIKEASIKSALENFGQNTQWHLDMGAVESLGFIKGAKFFRSEIMPSLIEQARVNAVDEVIMMLRSEKLPHEQLYQALFWADWLESQIKGDKDD